jgi:hypothetical protein
VAQQARNLLIHLGRFRLLIRDRETEFTAACDAVFATGAIEVLRTPVRRRGRMPVRSGGWTRFGVSCWTGC